MVNGTGMGNDIASSISGVQMRIEDEARALAQASPTSAMNYSADDLGPTDGVNFADALQQAIHGVDDKQRIADHMTEAVDSGKSDDLVGAMLASQTAGLSFSMLMQMRNKVASAMDELIKLSL